MKAYFSIFFKMPFKSKSFHCSVGSWKHVLKNLNWNQIVCNLYLWKKTKPTNIGIVKLSLMVLLNFYAQKSVVFFVVNHAYLYICMVICSINNEVKVAAFLQLHWVKIMLYTVFYHLPEHVLKKCKFSNIMQLMMYFMLWQVPWHLVPGDNF